jgi:hypothetical protein
VKFNSRKKVKNNMNSTALAARACLLACALLGAGAAQAAPVTYYFAGTMESSQVAPFISVGEAFSGSFTYNSAAALANGRYDTGMTIGASVGAHSWSASAPSATIGGVAVNDNGANGDEFVVSSYFSYPVMSAMTGPSPGGTSNYYMALLLRDTTSTAFSSGALPTVLNLASFDQSYLNVSFLTGSFSQAYAAGKLTYLSTVNPADTFNTPEPQSLLLALTALAGLVCLRTFRRA